MYIYKSLRNIKLHGTAEVSNGDEHTDNVSILNIVTQNKIPLEHQMQTMETKVFKLEEDNKNILRKLEDLLITTSNKM